MGKNAAMYWKKRGHVVEKNAALYWKTRPDTRLPQSHAGGQGPYLRSVGRLGRSGKAKNPINAKNVKCDGRMGGRTDGRTDGWTDGPTNPLIEMRGRI